MVKLYEVKISAFRTKAQRTLREQFKLLDVVSPNDSLNNLATFGLAQSTILRL